MKQFLLPIIFICMIVAGCSNTYTHIEPEDSERFMAENPDALIVDVRTVTEYNRKHIPKAVLVPIDEIRAGNFSALPDKDRKILLYCWTGRRAEDAANILVEHGYKNIYEIGGLINWLGEIEGTEKDEAKGDLN